MLIVECLHCNVVIRVKEGHGVKGKSSGMCDSCLTKHHPEEAAKVKAMGKCWQCLDRNLKCTFIACDALSKELDNIDCELKAKGE